RNRLRHAPAASVGLAEACFDELDALDHVSAHDLYGLAIEQEFDAFLPAVLVVPARAGHVALVTPVGAGHGFGTLADRGAIAIHTCIAATEHHDSLAAHADESLRTTGEAQLVIDVGDQVRESLIHAREVFTRETALDVRVGSHPKKDSVVLREERLEGNMGSNVDAEPKLDAHSFHHFTTFLDDILFELERRNSKCEQAANAGIAVEHHGRNAVSRKDICTTQ